MKRVAVCLYGQFRTFEYCAPWIESMFRLTDCQVSYFISTEAADSYNNVVGMSPSQPALLDVRSIRSALEMLAPKATWIYTQNQKSKLCKDIWFYAPMFLHMQTCLHQVMTQELKEGPFDLVIVSRLDFLLGPSLKTLDNWLKNHSHDIYDQPDHLYGLGVNMQRFEEARRIGMHDLFFFGSSYAVNSILAYTVTSIHDRSPRTQLNWQFSGPNILLRDAANDASIVIEDLHLPFALVRPTADLTRPVFDSFEYHHRFWTENHRGIPREETK